MNKQNLLGLDQRQLIDLVEALGEKPFRGKQLYTQIYRRRQTRLEQMTDLSTGFRTRLGEEHQIELPAVGQRSDSRDGTVKFLFQLEEGKFVETVYIPEEKRETLCISSQVGCDVGCTFCLTAQMGLERNLTAGEIVGQVLAVLAAGCIQRDTFNIVFMGMGEPLYNYKNVMRAFRLLTESDGMDLSHRRITISTSGVVPVLYRMHSEPSLPNLAVSLNATRDELRDKLMPLNQRWKIQELLEACRRFPLEARRRITFEYVLLGRVNDSDQEAQELARLVKGIKSKVNLIPYNPNPGLPYLRPSAARIESFRRILLQAHLTAFVRRPRGDDISAACGQLAYISSPEAQAGEVC